MSHKRYLVLVRAGCSHYFGNLLAVPAADRSWDLGVSQYEAIALPDDAMIEWHHQYSGGKWDGIWHFFNKYPEALEAYDFFWLVDDDIETDPVTVNKIFEYVRAHNFELAQPALTADSYYSHQITLRCPGFRHRHTNLVEIMAPILARNTLLRILPIIQKTRSGFGLDWLWHQFVTNPRKQIAIIDDLPVRHARPLRTSLQPAMELHGITPEKERLCLAAAYGLNRLYGITYEGVTQTGRTLKGRIRLTLALAINHLRQRKDIDKRPWGFKQTILLIWRQLFAPLGFTKN